MKVAKGTPRSRQGEAKKKLANRLLQGLKQEVIGPGGEDKREGQTEEAQDSSYSEPCWVLGFKPSTSSVSTCPELDSRDCLGRKKGLLQDMMPEGI